ncbi:MAG: lactate racemase domain-containing protein [Bacteroidota bacterium]
MSTIGKGSAEQALSDSEIREICSLAFSAPVFEGKRVLVLIPDHTRHARIDLFFHIICDLLIKRTKSLDFLIATGTHADMEPERIYRHVGITQAEHRSKFATVRFFNHEHQNPAALAAIGTIPADEIEQVTRGVFAEPLEITVNRKVLEYDHVIIVSPVVPHEAMGFAGGNKYFFPGIAGLKVIETFHWLGAILTNPAVNGVKDTPTRRLIERAAEFISTPRTCLAFAVDERNNPRCLFIGDPKGAWSRAADYSASLHISYVDKPYETVLAITPDLYEEVWVGGKAMYKLEPIVADGGEVIIYGPQIKQISFVHENDIRRIGYHVVEYFTKQWERFKHEPKLILAHSTNVRGIGTFADGVERPRINVTLATSISEEICKKVNLGFRDYRTIDLKAWRSKKDKNTMVVENAGQNLFRLKNGQTH